MMFISANVIARLTPINQPLATWLDKWTNGKWENFCHSRHCEVIAVFTTFVLLFSLTIEWKKYNFIISYSYILYCIVQSLEIVYIFIRL